MGSRLETGTPVRIHDKHMRGPQKHWSHYGHIVDCEEKHLIAVTTTDNQTFILKRDAVMALDPFGLHIKMRQAIAMKDHLMKELASARKVIDTLKDVLPLSEVTREVRMLGYLVRVHATRLAGVIRQGAFGRIVDIQTIDEKPMYTVDVDGTHVFVRIGEIKLVKEGK